MKATEETKIPPTRWDDAVEPPSILAPSDSQTPKSSPSANVSERLATLFPSVVNHEVKHRLSSWPSEVIVCDEDLISQPLQAYDGDTCDRHYPGPRDDSAAAIPECPQDFLDPYLFPQLTKNEVARLTSLWYYTRSMEEDSAVLSELQNVVDTIQDIMQHDFAVLGFMDQDTYTRIATVNCPLANYPRRESICAHTILHLPRDVLILPDMLDDWRFRSAPHVVEVGIRSYAGTQLSYSVPDTDLDVVFGTLCVASYDTAPPLTLPQRKTLVRLARTAVHIIVRGAQVRRRKAQEEMSARLYSVLPYLKSSNVVSRVLDILRISFPGCQASYQVQRSAFIQLQGGVSVAYADIQNWLWVATDELHKLIISKNHLSIESHDQALRSIIVKMKSIEDTYLVVETTSLKLIFDDIDAAFVVSCAMTICNTLMGDHLQVALAAKEEFLRGAMHDLRTPIHAIIASSELLLEDASVPTHDVSALHLNGTHSREMDRIANGRLHSPPSPPASTPPSPRSDPSSGFSSVQPDKALSLIELVNTSGRSLLETVNHVIEFDAPAPLPNHAESSTQNSDCSLTSLEEEVVQSVLLTPIANVRRLSVQLLTSNLLPLDSEIIYTDAELLKEALRALLINALWTTQEGTVVLSTSLSDGRDSIDYDVIDTGTGIPPEDVPSVFIPSLSAVNENSPERGNGLHVATRIATLLNGKVSVVSSSPGFGSHLRLRLRKPVLSVDDGGSGLKTRLQAWDVPLTYYRLFFSEEETEQETIAVRNLESLGFRCTKKEEANFALVVHPACGTRVEEAMLPWQAAVVVAYADDVSPLSDRIFYWRWPWTRANLLTAVFSALAFCQNDDIRNLRRQQSTPPVQSRSSAQSSKRCRSGLRLLIVDDNEISLRILVAYAKKRGFGHASAYDGTQAVRLFTEEAHGPAPFTMVLMDLQMPVMDGADAARAMRQLEADRAIEPALVYMFSGQSLAKDRKRALDSGADGYYVRPFTLCMVDDLIDLHFDKPVADNIDGTQ